MRKDMLTIIKKEFARFFGDKRLLFTTVIMPGLLIYVMYSIMGKGLMKTFTTAEDYVATIYTVNMPQELSGAFAQLNADFKETDMSVLNTIEEKIKNDEADALIIFPEDFMAAVESYDITTGEAAPNVSVYFNSADTDSSTVYSGLVAILDMYEMSIANKMDINAGEGPYDLATEEETTGMLFSMIMPMLLLIFLFSGCMSVAPDSIAGEKERGTIATLLVTPMKRSSLALGKIFSLSAIALLSGISSFIGTMVSLPSLVGGDMEGVSASVYTTKEYVLLLGIILSTVLLFVSILSVISAYAKSVKEATTLILPVMLVVMGLSITSMMGGNQAATLADSLIPIYGIVRSISGIFGFNYQLGNVVAAIGMNILCSGVLTFLLTKMFNDERIMFSN